MIALQIAIKLDDIGVLKSRWRSNQKWSMNGS